MTRLPRPQQVEELIPDLLAPSCPVPLDARPAGLTAPPPQGQPAARGAENEWLQSAPPVDDSWVEDTVCVAEREAIERRRRPLYREALMAPERRPVFRCWECYLECSPEERDCPQCGCPRRLEVVR